MSFIFKNKGSKDKPELWLRVASVDDLIKYIERTDDYFITKGLNGENNKIKEYINSVASTNKTSFLDAAYNWFSTGRYANKADLLRRYGIIYINPNGGVYPMTKEEDNLLETFVSEKLDYNVPDLYENFVYNKETGKKIYCRCGEHAQIILDQVLDKFGTCTPSKEKDEWILNTLVIKSNYQERMQE